MTHEAHTTPRLRGGATHRRIHTHRRVVMRAARPRLALLMRWVGAAAALAVFALSSGFFLLKDYQKVRVLRTVEQWVTDSQPSFVPEPTDNGL